MRFSIEIYTVSPDGAEGILHRESVDTINLVDARKEAERLFASWKKRNANGARVLNSEGQEIFRLAG